MNFVKKKKRKEIKRYIKDIPQIVDIVEINFKDGEKLKVINNYYSYRDIKTNFIISVNQSEVKYEKILGTKILNYDRYLYKEFDDGSETSKFIENVEKE